MNLKKFKKILDKKYRCDKIVYKAEFNKFRTYAFD